MNRDDHVFFIIGLSPTPLPRKRGYYTHYKYISSPTLAGRRGRGRGILFMRGNQKGAYTTIKIFVGQIFNKFVPYFLNNN
jgi:hypothetical protein